MRMFLMCQVLFVGGIFIGMAFINPGQSFPSFDFPTESSNAQCPDISVLTQQARRDSAIVRELFSMKEDMQARESFEPEDFTSFFEDFFKRGQKVAAQVERNPYLEHEAFFGFLSGVMSIVEHGHRGDMTPC